MQVAHYAYDAYGNFEILQGKEETSIANINPFRYRGYYYDTETGLYYLISRYYDPETCRFISADSIEYLDPETLGGLNLYAYCCNNPVMMTDEDGTMPKWLRCLLGVVIIVASVAASIMTAGLMAPFATTLGGGLAATIVAGAAVGALGGAISACGISIATQGISKGFDKIDPMQVLSDTLFGAASGAIAGAIFGAINYVASADKIAKGLSGLSEAMKNAEKADFVLRFTPIKIAGGVMATERVMAQLGYNVARFMLDKAQSVYKVLKFLLFSKLYSLAQAGLKFLINNSFKR